MRKRLFPSFTTFIVCTIGYLSAGIAQDFSLNGTSINSCGGNFFDSGGSSGGYSANEDLSATICPIGSGDKEVQLAFQVLDLGIGDTLFVYDSDIADPNRLITTLHIDNQTVPVVVSPDPDNPSGCLRVRFVSDGTDNRTGWQAQLSCTNRCQAIKASIQSSLPAPGPEGTIDLCPGQPLSLEGIGTYPENNILYSQSDASSTFRWNFGNGQTQSGQTTTYTYDQPGGYVLRLTITDQRGCTNDNVIAQRVRVAAPPVLSGTLDADTVCVGDTIRLSADGLLGATFPELEYNLLPIRSDTQRIEDGTAIATQSSITYEEFSPGATLTDPSNLRAICATLEHSFFSDLQIVITCPSGQVDTLYDNPSNTLRRRYMGIPVRETGPTPGEGFQYCWTPDATETIEAFADANDPDILGQAWTLPPGSYQPDRPFDNLVGCPLNGTWTLSLLDKNQLDDGFLFGWQIDFDSSLLQNSETFQQIAVDSSWQAGPTVARVDADSLIALATAPGNQAYTYTITDNFGCTFDTSFAVPVRALSDPACSNCQPMLAALAPQTACVGDALSINAALRTNLDTTLRFASNRPLSFPDQNPGMSDLTLETDLEVGGILPASLDNVNQQFVGVSVNLEVGNNQEVTLELIAPNGSSVPLWNADAAGSNFTGTTFSPTATQPITAGTPPYSGTFLPIGNFNNFQFGPANGNWRLRLTRLAGSTTPIRLIDWSIQFAIQNPIDFEWDPSPDLSCLDCPEPTLTVSQSAIYRVRATDAYGCSESATLDVQLGSIISAPQVSCSTTDDSAIFTWDDVSPNGQYETRFTRNGVVFGWEGPLAATTRTFDNLSNGDIIALEVRAFADGSICEAEEGSSNCLINSCDFTLEITNTIPPLCFGGSDGVAEFRLTGDAGDISLRLDGQVIPKNEPIENLVAGTYTLEATTPQGCSEPISFTIDDPDSLTILANTTAVTCVGSSDGQITVSVSGGAPTYQYRIDNEIFTATPNFSNLPAGPHRIEVRDRNGCTNEQEVLLPAPDSIRIQLSTTAPRCTDVPNGQIESIVEGAVGNLTYAWSTGAVTPTISDLPAGDYCLTVTDANGCTATACTNLQPPNPLVIDRIEAFDVSCFGAADGQAVVTASGGQGSYSYRWNDPLVQIADTARFLMVGIYEVVVTDSAGCTASGSAFVSSPDSLQLGFSITDGDCSSANAGRLEALPNGGTPPYSLLWENGSTNAVRTQLSIGTYRLTLTDANGCTLTDSARIAGPPAPLTLDIQQIERACSGLEENAAQVTPLGGAGSNYTYLWSTGAATATVSNLPEGTYSVTVTDGATCQKDTTIELQSWAPVDFVLIAEPPTCQGDNNGGMGITQISGGAGTQESDYTFSWSTGSTAIALTDLSGGASYTVTVTDAQGCSRERSRLLTDPISVQFDVNAQNVSCADEADGLIRLENLQGPNPESFTIRLRDSAMAEADSLIENLAAGTYTVIVEDAEGCSQSTDVSIGAPLALTAEVEVSDLRCFEGADGSASASVSGGVPPYTYDWSNGNQEAIARGLPAGNYSLTITDTNGCTLEEAIRIDNPPLLESGIQTKDVSCAGLSNGEIIVNPTGGEAPYTYSLDNSNFSNSNTFRGLSAGAYSVFVRDRRGCTFPAEVEVVAPPEVRVDLGTSIELLYGDSVSLTPSITNAQEPVELRWREGTAGTLSCTDCPVPVALPQSTTMIELTAIDANGCAATDQVEIMVVRDRQVYVPNAFSPNSDGRNDFLTVYGRPSTQVTLFQVYDNWGSLVFERENLSINTEEEGWDGSYRNEPAQTGTYVWRAVVVFPDGFTVNRHGSVTLVR